MNQRDGVRGSCIIKLKLFQQRNFCLSGSLCDTGKRDFGSQVSQITGGPGTHGAGNSYAVPGITKLSVLPFRAAVRNSLAGLMPARSDSAHSDFSVER